MSDQHHKWRVGQEPPLIRPHSLAKHKVVASYLKQYVSVLTADPRQEQLRLTLVDGFAGGGRYLDSRTKEERPGSPMIMLNAMHSAAVAAQEARSKPFHLDVQYFFIEENPDALAYLTEVLTQSEYRAMLNDRVHLLPGEFTSHVSKLIEFVKGRGRAGRVIFLLDQCGYVDVPLPAIRNVLEQLDNAEIILTFATDWLIDYLGTDDQAQQRLDRLGIRLPPKEIATAKEHRDWRRVIQFALHREIPERTGARYYTPFFIRSTDAHRDFWLIHLSGHYRARDVMVGLHWQQSTDFAHYGRSGLRMLGYDAERDLEWNKQKLLAGFFFDETARASSVEELSDQLPEQIHGFKDGIAFRDLFAKVTNECPVTAEIMKQVLSEHAKQGVVLVRDKTGGHPLRVRHDSDIIIPSRQKRIFPARSRDT